MAERPTFEHAACGLVLHDGVVYNWCPRCSAPLEPIEGRAYVEPQPQPPGPAPVLPDRRVETWLLRVALVVVIVLVAIEPARYPVVGLALLIVQIVAALGVVAVALLVPAVRDLARDQRVRVLHGLEHATIRILQARGAHIRSGTTRDHHFTIVADNDGSVFLAGVKRAATEAIERIRAGEHALAYHEGCGTSAMVGLALVSLGLAGVGIAAAVLGWSLAIELPATIVVWIAARAARQPLGLLAQRTLTVSTNLASAAVRSVKRNDDDAGRCVTFTVAIDVVVRARGAEAIAP